MTIIKYVKTKIDKYGRLRSFLVAATFISAAAALFIALWFTLTFFDLIGAFKDFHNMAVDIMRCCGFIFRALSLIILFIFFVRDYGRHASSKFEIALLFLFIESIFEFTYYVFNSVWNSVEYLSRSDIATGITLRVLVFILFLLSLYGLYRQSKIGFCSSFKKTVLLILFILATAASVYLDQSRVYARINVSGLIFAELAGFFVYSPYIMYIAFSSRIKQKRPAKPKGFAKQKTNSQKQLSRPSRPKSSHARREPRMK